MAKALMMNYYYPSNYFGSNTSDTDSSTETLFMKKVKLTSNRGFSASLVEYTT